MKPRRAVAIVMLITFVTGLILAGYNGTSIYVWYTTGKLEILGSLEDKGRFPLYFMLTLILNFGGFIVGLGLLVFGIAEFAILSKSFTNKRR